jgi:hypothetical protein
LSSTMVAPPLKASNRLGFLCGMTKTDAHELPLAIPTLNFIRNELQSPDFAGFRFLFKIGFYL